MYVRVAVDSRTKQSIFPLLIFNHFYNLKTLKKNVTQYCAEKTRKMKMKTKKIKIKIKTKINKI